MNISDWKEAKRAHGLKKELSPIQKDAGAPAADRGMGGMLREGCNLETGMKR